MRSFPLRGRRVLITAGATREHLDPIRFLTNASSGRMGFALASAARALGARVCVVCGPTPLEPPRGVECVRVVSAAEMMKAVDRKAKSAAIVIGAAAVCDWRFAGFSRHKIKRKPGAIRLTLVPNPDIIKTAAMRRRAGQIFIGFALESRRMIAYARRKLKEKSLDLIVANTMENIASKRARVTLVGPDAVRRIPVGTKPRIARSIVREAAKLLESRN